MILEDGIQYGVRAILANRERSGLTILGILIGIASVILLTAIGKGARDYMVDEFTQFGTNLVAINPGKVQTTGSPGALGGTVNPLTVDDATAILRLPGVTNLVPFVAGTATVEYGQRNRSVVVYGVNSEVPRVWRFPVRVGRFLPESDFRRGSPLTVLGPKLKRELFGDENALGESVRISGQRFLVIGVMAEKGQFLGFDLDDTAYVPLSIAQSLFNEHGLDEIDLLVSNASYTDSVEEEIRQLLMDRHDGEEDFTITTQSDMLASTDRVLGVVSLAVAGIGAISLLVGAIGILTMMWISVNERTAEIGLVKAMGATGGQILALFLGEAVLLSTVGGVLGVVTGVTLAKLLALAVPGLPVAVSLRYIGLAVLVSLVVGLASGILPARRAAALDPIDALSAE